MNMNLKVDKCNRVLRIELDRPEKRNALTFEMCHGIADAVEGAQQDPQIGSILITASGPVFCSGMDIAERVTGDEKELSAVHDRLFTMGAKSVKPIVVGVNGAAFGGGLGLAVQGHVVLAETHSVFALPEIKLGLWPFLIYRSMEEAIGSRRLLALSLTGRNFTAEDALAWGIVHQICHDDEVCERGGVIARELAKSSPVAIAAGMQYVCDSRGKGWEEAGQIAASLREALMEGDDYKEGVRAFKEKRHPRWPSIPQ
jgi:enoyl-CoA hydratase/carnithine racemase